VDIEEGTSTFKKAVPLLKQNEWIVGNSDVILVKGVDGVHGTTNSLIIATIDELEQSST